MRAYAGRQFVPFLWWSLVWPGREANSRPTVWEADTLPTEPTRHGHLSVQWNSSCEANLFVPEKWPYKRGDLLSGVKINTIMFRSTFSSGLSRAGGPSKGVLLYSITLPWASIWIIILRIKEVLVLAARVGCSGNAAWLHVRRRAPDADWLAAAIGGYGGVQSTGPQLQAYGIKSYILTFYWKS